MEWISSTELMEMLRRFPDTEIEAKRYTLRAEHTLFSWEYRKESSKFCYQLDGKTKQLTERGFLRKFRSDHWRPEQFFFLDDEKQKSLAVHLVEHLTMTGNLDWILCECDVTFLRKCDHCHKLMNEGWMCGETYHYSGIIVPAPLVDPLSPPSGSRRCRHRSEPSAQWRCLADGCRCDCYRRR